MGGKSRKTGGISKRLIDQIKKQGTNLKKQDSKKGVNKKEQQDFFNSAFEEQSDE